MEDQAIACTVVDDAVDDAYLARCTVRDEVDLGGYLVRAGLALADRDVADDYVPLEQSAKAAAAGAWAVPSSRPGSGAGDDARLPYRAQSPRPQPAGVASRVPPVIRASSSKKARLRGELICQFTGTLWKPSS